jgi:hypothetical protein
MRRIQHEQTRHVTHPPFLPESVHQHGHYALSIVDADRVVVGGKEG